MDQKWFQNYQSKDHGEKKSWKCIKKNGQNQLGLKYQHVKAFSILWTAVLFYSQINDFVQEGNEAIMLTVLRSIFFVNLT